MMRLVDVAIGLERRFSGCWPTIEQARVPILLFSYDDKRSLRQGELQLACLSTTRDWSSYVPYSQRRQPYSVAR